MKRRDQLRSQGIAEVKRRMHTHERRRKLKDETRKGEREGKAKKHEMETPQKKKNYKSNKRGGRKAGTTYRNERTERLNVKQGKEEGGKMSIK